MHCSDWISQRPVDLGGKRLCCNEGGKNIMIGSAETRLTAEQNLKSFVTALGNQYSASRGSWAGRVSQHPLESVKRIEGARDEHTTGCGPVEGATLVHGEMKYTLQCMWQSQEISRDCNSKRQWYGTVE